MMTRSQIIRQGHGMDIGRGIDVSNKNEYQVGYEMDFFLNDWNETNMLTILKYLSIIAKSCSL